MYKTIMVISSNAFHHHRVAYNFFFFLDFVLHLFTKYSIHSHLKCQREFQFNFPNGIKLKPVTIGIEMTFEESVWAKGD